MLGLLLLIEVSITCEWKRKKCQEARGALGALLTPNLAPNARPPWSGFMFLQCP